MLPGPKTSTSDSDRKPSGLGCRSKPEESGIHRLEESRWGAPAAPVRCTTASMVVQFVPSAETGTRGAAGAPVFPGSGSSPAGVVTG